MLIASLFQAFAALPGVSRSGITISILLYLGVNHIDATRFSFLMAIPLILGASILSLFDTGFSIISYLSIVGILISCIFEYRFFSYSFLNKPGSVELSSSIDLFFNSLDKMFEALL